MRFLLAPECLPWLTLWMPSCLIAHIAPRSPCLPLVKRSKNGLVASLILKWLQLSWLCQITSGKTCARKSIRKSTVLPTPPAARVPRNKSTSPIFFRLHPTFAGSVSSAAWHPTFLATQLFQLRFTYDHDPVSLGFVCLDGINRTTASSARIANSAFPQFSRPSNRSPAEFQCHS